MCLLVDEKTDIGDHIPQSDFLDLDIYRDLDHILLDLRYAIIYSIRVMNRYYKVFRYIIKYLKEGRTLTVSTLDYCIFYSDKIEDIMIFLLVRGSSIYTLKYLINIIKDLLIRNEFKQSEAGLALLLRYLNNTGYNLI